MNDFQEGWLEGFRAAQSRIVAELATKHGAAGMLIAPKILKIKPNEVPMESRVEKVEISGD